ncbi:MAG: YceI family protein [Georgfuchsia sp.]
MNSLLFSFMLAAVIASSAHAVELNQVAAGESRIDFAGKQMGVAVDGSFKKFEAQISLDPARPEAGKARVDVDLASIDAGSDEATTELKGKTWLDIAAFPKASFVASSIKALGAGRYEAHGTLSIKGISRDTVVPFSIRNEGPGSWLEGGFVIPRLQFRIGEDAWSDTSTVADEIQVKFKLFLSTKQ